MTLHITCISTRYTLQVSDRLVSGGMHDPLANKNLIYSARDAIVTIGYTGLAYGLSPSNRDMPTDEWIAEQLWGQSIPRGHDGARPVTIATARIGRWLDIGQSVELLRSRLDNSVSRLKHSWSKLPFEVIIAGWQETRRHGVQPVLVQIIKREGNAPCAIERPARYWHLGHKVGLVAMPDGYLPKNELADLGEMLRRSGPDESESRLARCIRHVASRHTCTVGPHSMSILLPPPGIAPIRVRFIPAVPHFATFYSEKQNRQWELPVAFSPWVVGQNGFLAPSINVGESRVQLGSREIVIEAPAPDHGTRGYLGALDRPKGP